MYLCRWNMPHIVPWPILSGDRRREVVDKQRPMFASKCWMWLEREVGCPRVVLVLCNPDERRCHGQAPYSQGLDRSRSASPNPGRLCTVSSTLHWHLGLTERSSRSRDLDFPALKSITKPSTSKLYITDLSVKPQYFDSSYTLQFLVASSLYNSYFRMHGFTSGGHHPVPTPLKVLDNIYFLLRMPYKMFI